MFIYFSYNQHVHLTIINNDLSAAWTYTIRISRTESKEQRGSAIYQTDKLREYEVLRGRARGAQGRDKVKPLHSLPENDQRRVSPEEVFMGSHYRTYT